MSRWLGVRFLVIYQVGLTRGEWLRWSAVPAASRRRRCHRATTANTMASIATATVFAVRMRLPVVLMGRSF